MVKKFKCYVTVYAVKDLLELIVCVLEIENTSFAIFLI